MEKRNTVSLLLFWIGIVNMVICFFIGLNFGEENTDSYLYSSLPWWLGGLISGMIFIGFSEVINLIQKIVDHNSSLSEKSVAKGRDQIKNNLQLDNDIHFYFLELKIGDKIFDGFIKSDKETWSIFEKKADDSKLNAKLVAKIPNTKINDIVIDSNNNKMLVLHYITNSDQEEQLFITTQTPAKSYDIINYFNDTRQ